MTATTKGAPRSEREGNPSVGPFRGCLARNGSVPMNALVHIWQDEDGMAWRMCDAKYFERNRIVKGFTHYGHANKECKRCAWEAAGRTVRWSGE